MPVLGCWPSYEELEPFGISGFSRSTSATHINTDYVSSGMEVSGSVDQFQIPLASARTNLWIRFHIFDVGIEGAAQQPVVFYDGATPIYRVLCDYHVTYYLQKWNGSSWVNLILYTQPTWDVKRTNMIHLDMDNDVFEIWEDDVLAGSYSGDLSGTGSTSFDSVSFGAFQGQSSHYSQIIFGDQDLTGCEAFSLVPSGAGNYTAWSGDFNTVDEVDDAYSAPVSAGDRSTYTHPNLYASAPPEVPYAAVACSAKTLSVAAGDDMNLMLRSASTDYDGTGIDLTADRELYVYDVSSTINNSVSTLNAAEPGMKAV